MLTDMYTIYLSLVLSDNPVLRDKFFEKLPGGILVFTIYKWLVVGIIALYIIPITIYAIFYCHCSFLIDVIFGTVSFLFYTPTYTNLLSSFALCRIDDISWGTKGLDAGNDRYRSLKESWRVIKIMHVAKFIFWNVIVAIILLVISSPFYFVGYTDNYNNPEAFQEAVVDSYVRKFFMVLGLMVIIGFSLFLKIFLAAVYTIAYRCCNSGRNSGSGKKNPTTATSHVDACF